jgi:ribosomal protein L11 methylase PrmA
MILRDSASFRDPAGHVYLEQDKVYRTVMPVAAEAFTAVRATGLINRLIEQGKLWPETLLSPSQAHDIAPQAYAILQHPPLPFITYPYEWPFALLKAAALFHLDLQLEALQAGVMLNDASAFNIQFIGTQPVFIDHLAFRPYQEGELWQAHQQFCQQFLNPLLLQAHCGVAFNSWYRGNLQGITTRDIAKVLPLRSKFSWHMLTQVLLQAHFDKGQRQLVNQATRTTKLPKAGLVQLWQSLRKWISTLNDKQGNTTWQGYAHDNSYADNALQQKHAFIAEFAAQTCPALLWDIGCNQGQFSQTALKHGAKYAIGLDFDGGALQLAYTNACKQHLNFLPLVGDITNPTPAQGWAEHERKSWSQRGPADAILALAVVHHLAIHHNVPLPMIIDWLLQLAPQGVIEFVPKSDPMLQLMLSQRPDIFPNYHLPAFIEYLTQHANIVSQQTLLPSNRELIHYRRKS